MTFFLFPKMAFFAHNRIVATGLGGVQENKTVEDMEWMRDICIKRIKMTKTYLIHACSMRGR